MCKQLLTMFAALGVTGCVGSLDSDGFVGTNPGGGQAKQLFQETVYPIIHAPGTASDCSGCHDSKAPSNNVTGFVSANVADAYATITSFQSVVGNFTPTAAGILLRMSPTDVHVTSRGRAFTNEQRQKITAWLAADLAERGGNVTTGGATANALNQFSACMTLANWQAANMTTVWGNMQANDGADCKSCHASGGQGMMISDVESTGVSGPPGMWSVVSSHETYLVQYFSVDVSGSTPRVIVNTKSFEGVGLGIPPHAEHPQFDPQNNPGMDALQQFYTLTVQNLGSCMPSGSKLTPPAS